MICPMVRAIVKWTLILASVLGVGPAIGAMVGLVRGPTGGPDATLLSSDSPAQSLGLGLAALAIAAAYGALAARLVTRTVGLVCAGLIVGWAAWRLGSMDQIIHARQSAGSLGLIAFEGLGLCIAAIGMFKVIDLAARSPKALHPPPPNPLHDLLAKGNMLGVAGAIVIGGGVVYLIAFDDLKGQTVVAAILAAAMATVTGAFLATSRKARFSPYAPLIALAVLAVAAPFAARIFHGTRIVDAAYRGELLALCRPISLDWVVGALLGIPLGFSWAGSLTHPPASK